MSNEAKTVVIAGTLDTKAAEFSLVRSLVEAHGCRALLIDVGILGEPGISPHIRSAEVAQAGGSDLEALREGGQRQDALETMGRGLAAICVRLFKAGDLHGMLGMGGSGGTTIATVAMRALPFGIPKLMVSTLASGDVRPFVGATDIVMMPSVVDVSGINRVSGAVYANAAAAIAGMVQAEAPAIDDEKPLVTASMFGNTTPCVDSARAILEAAGYEVLIFHATGIGGRTMEALIAEGYAAGCFDITMTELADEVCGGGASAGPERGMAASRAGIPAVLVPGCVDMANFGAPDSLPERYRGRVVYQWAPSATLLRTNVEENQRIGGMIAEAANAATAKVAVALPLKGLSMLDIPGGEFWDPAADGACFTAIKDHLLPDIPLIELNHNINDPEFAQAVAAEMLDLLDT